MDLGNSVTPSNVKTFVLQGSWKKREKGTGNICLQEIIAENFPNLGRETKIQIQEVQISPNKSNPRKSTPRHTVIKVAKSRDRQRIIKATRGTENSQKQTQNK